MKSFIYCASGEVGIHLLTLGADKVLRATQAHSAKSFFLAAHPHRPILYSIDEAAGMVTAFAVVADGLLFEMTRLKTQGTVPCHLAVDPNGRYLVVAAYGGSLEIFPLRLDGGLESSSDLFQPVGRGPDPRQEGPHPHGIALIDDLAYVADLGADCIFILKIESTPPRFMLLPEWTQSLPPGSGPRHFIVHPDGTHAMAINELDNTVISFSRDSTSGRLTRKGSLSTLPSGFKEASWAAEIGYHPRAGVGYASNRGHDSLVVFSVDRFTGELQLKQFIAAGGEKPQHFLLDPFGSMLLIANTGSNGIALYRMDPILGLPVEQLPDLPMKKPMCLASLTY